jgi:peptide/nickel transport system permease protein
VSISQARAGVVIIATPPNAVSAFGRRRQHRSLAHDAWRRFHRHRLALAGGLVFVSLGLLTLFGPLVWHVGINDLDLSGATTFSAAHPMGADDLGRDVLTRLLWGGRISLAVGLCTMLLAVSIGVGVGALAGLFGGMLDLLLSRLVEVLLAVPQLPLLLVLVYLFRDPLARRLGVELGVFVLIVLVLGGLHWMPTARLVRAGFLVEREREYVVAARCIGAGPVRLMRQILPNVLSPIIVAATLAVGSAMLAEATLSFLGLGFPPDTPTWGRLLYDAQPFLTVTPSLAVFPGLVIFLAVLSINFLGDGLRDAFDPRARV